jgi:uncharacterized Zn-binding protein involved in type VI secretion
MARTGWINVINIVRLGDPTDRGSVVITASQSMKLRGIPIARVGGQVRCPRHPDTSPNVITEGDQELKDRGVPVARHGHKATCGCKVDSHISRESNRCCFLFAAPSGAVNSH